MDYDDIDYDESYSIRDIENNWLNSNMDYDDINLDSDSDIDDYCKDANRNEPNCVGFARDKAQIMSFVERGFERLGFGH